MKFNFFNRLILRSAALPYSLDLNEKQLFKLWTDPLIREGIFLASKPLYFEIVRFLEKEGKDDLFSRDGITSDQLSLDQANAGKNNAKEDAKNTAALLQSLYKYISRMSNRSTPFGIFSGVTALEWGADTEIVLNDNFHRQVTPDAVLNLELAKLTQQQNSDAQYKINNTVYRQGNEYRFISYEVVDGERFYQLSSLKYNEVLEYLIEDMRDYALSRSQIIALSGYETEEFIPFLNQLIDIQFLKYAYQPGIGLEFPDFIVRAELPTKKQNAGTDHSDDIAQLINKFDHINNKIATPIDYVARYQDLEQDVINLLGVTPMHTFHVTRFNTLDKAFLSTSLQHKLEKAIRLLNNLGNYEPNPRVERFIKEFRDKYQERSVPLLEVFDTDIGLAYGKWHEKSTLFTEGLEGVSFVREQSGRYTAADLKLLKVATDAYHHRAYTFIMPDDFAEERSMDQLPHTMSATFQVFETGTISLEQVAGTGAIGLLARFAAGSKAINDLALDITEEEALANPDAIYAEIIHMPEERSMNIMAHPPFWSYEIQYIDQANGKHIISLGDLEVLLVGNSFRLFSPKHQKEIIPRLSSAYNYSRSQHPIYTFLCDIQHQQSNNGLLFKWGELAENQIFFPRVITKSGVILQRATWKFTSASLQELQPTDKSFDKFKKLLSNFRLHWMLPAYFLIVKGDNELLIDCENDISLHVLFKDINKKPAELILKECLHREWTTVVKNNNQDSYAHQFVAPFSISNVKAVPKINPIPTALKREFFPGSEWLYVKIFLGENTVQPVLLQLYRLFENTERSAPLFTVVSKWFFIRYKEGGNHIRFRVNLRDPLYFQQVFFAIMEVLSPFLKDKLISTVQLDTYEREIERYSAEKMELAEELFAADSRFCCKTFGLLQQDYMHTDWLLVFWAVTDYLHRMSPDQVIQLKFAERQLAYFLQEFDDKIIKVQIDQLNRKYRGAVDPLQEQYHELLEIRKAEVDSILSGNLVLWDERFLGSMIHMLLNRYFNTQQRLHECLLYGFIVKALKTDIARSSPKFGQR